MVQVSDDVVMILSGLGPNELRVKTHGSDVLGGVVSFLLVCRVTSFAEC